MKVSNLRSNQHLGKKIERIRELKGIKQDALAAAMGVAQQTISKIEQSEHIDDERLRKIADAMGVTIDAIKNFNEEAILNLIQNNHENSSYNYLIGYQYNPVEKVVELYERMLKEKDEQIAMYRKQLNVS